MEMVDRVDRQSDATEATPLGVIIPVEVGEYREVREGGREGASERAREGVGEWVSG